MASRDERRCWLSHEALADRTGTSVRTVKRDLAKLVRLGWLLKFSGRKSGHTNRYQVQFAALPYGNLKPTLVSPWAEECAKDYYRELLKIPGKRKLAWRGWEQRWGFSLQKMLDRSGADAEVVNAAIAFAFSDQRFRNRAILGPDRLLPHWYQLVEATKGAELARRFQEHHRNLAVKIEAMLSEKLRETSVEMDVA
jgi:hypothetical protein